MKKIKLSFENIDFYVLQFNSKNSSQSQPESKLVSSSEQVSSLKIDLSNKPLLIFATGGGGNPERHLGLLEFFADCGFHVVAPYFERITSPRPSHDELRLRINILRGALAKLVGSGQPVFGIGHSIGATLLLALAGAKIWMQNKECVPVTPEPLLKKVVMMTPPTGFFKAPNALDDVSAAVQAWAGGLDTMTPPEQIQVLQMGLPSKTFFEVQNVEKAAHFSFMNVLPPNANDPMSEAERLAFLKKLSSEILRFLLKDFALPA